MIVRESGVLHLFFFFQAEDGIRDYKVTGVQTCALPIYPVRRERVRAALGRVRSADGLPGARGLVLRVARAALAPVGARSAADLRGHGHAPRSEERRVGKGRRSLSSRLLPSGCMWQAWAS